MGRAAEIIEAPTTEIAAYRPFWEELGKLKEDNKKLVFQYATPKGNKEARSHVYNLRKRKADIERARKTEKQDALEYGRQVDSQAKLIAGEYDEMIELHQKPLDELERAEADRVSAHEAKIADLTGLIEFDCIGFPLLGDITARVDLAKSFTVDATLEEFQEKAASAKSSTIETLENMLQARQKHDAEQAELERLRAELAAKEKQENEDRIARETEQRVRAEAEAKARAEREQAELKAKTEKDAAERREQDLRDAAAKSEREKLEAEQRAINAAKEAEAKAKRDAEEAKRLEQEETARRERDTQHKTRINRTALDALVAGGLSAEQAKLAITLIAKRKIPSITIQY